MQTNGIVQEIEERTPVIAATTLHAGLAQVRTMSQNLSRRGAMAAKAHFCNEAVLRLIELVFEKDTDDGPANLDRASYRILIPLPWGENGHRAYGLRSTEQRALRRHMFALQNNKDGDPPLFVYDPVCRSWFLNIWDHYTSKRVALNYWEQWRLNDKSFRALYRK